MSKFDAMDEDSLLQAVETAEAENDFKTIVDILRASSSESKDVEDFEAVAEAACDAILRTSIEKAAELGDAGAVESVCSAMKRFKEQPAIIEVCCGIIKDLANGNSSNQKKLAQAGAPTLLVTRNLKLLVASSKHVQNIGEATLQEQACLAVESLSRGNAEISKLLVDAGIKTSLYKAKGLITNDRNKSYPDRAITSITEALGSFE